MPAQVDTFALQEWTPMEGVLERVQPAGIRYAASHMRIAAVTPMEGILERTLPRLQSRPPLVPTSVVKLPTGSSRTTPDQTRMLRDLSGATPASLQPLPEPATLTEPFTARKASAMAQRARAGLCSAPDVSQLSLQGSLPNRSLLSRYARFAHKRSHSEDHW